MYAIARYTYIYLYVYTLVDIYIHAKSIYICIQPHISIYMFVSKFAQSVCACVLMHSLIYT